MNLFTRLNEQFVVPIIRENDEMLLESICLSLADGGFHVLEIALMNQSAFSVIKKLSTRKDLLIGAGTIITANDAEKAMDCGAHFLVSPGLNKEAFSLAQKRSIPFIPGVLTPTEIMQATLLGAELVKIFPVGALNGSQYIKLLQGPFPNLNMMASGGITLKDLNGYIKTGVKCVALGHHFMPVEKIKAQEWRALTQFAEQYKKEITILRA
jgi:2-dehydro-3-deoxyphosphogluconate aldolase/(4S)-4-hydroxy-2-oxoglutarate aldolase